MRETVWTATVLRERLAEIVVRASERGRGRTLSLAEAARVVSALVASDDAPEWIGVREDGNGTLDRLRTVVAIIRDREGGNR